MGLGPDDPQQHKVKKGETLTSIGKKYGVSVGDLTKLNKLKDPNKIKAGQMLSVNPETDFSNNPRGGYENKDNPHGEQISMDNIANVGLGFAVGAGSENMIVRGGEALDQLKGWSAVSEAINSNVAKTFADGVAEPGEAYFERYSAGNIPSYLKRVWNGEDDLVSPIHIIGSFTLSTRVNADGKTMTIAVYDSKTIASLSDGNLGKNYNVKRDNANPKPLTTQYFRFIWTVPIQK
jgi:LysM repeat protein